MSTSKQILNFIIKEKAQGNTFQELNTQMKIMMKGVNVKSIMEGNEQDDPAAINRLKEIAEEFGVDLSKMPQT